MLPGAKGLEVDLSNNRLVFFSPSESALAAININTGEQTILSAQSRGVGPAIVSGTDVKLTADNTKAYVIDSGNAAVISVDLNTGNRTVITGIGTGAGPNLPQSTFAAGLDLDETNNRIFVYGLHDVYAVNILTGERSIFSTANVNSSNSKSSETVLDLPNNRILYVRNEMVIALDLATGNTTTLVNLDDNNALYTSEVLNGIAITNTGEIFLSHQNTGEVVKLNAGTYSAETLLAELHIGSGTPLKGATAIALDVAGGTAFVSYEDINRGIAAVNLIDGNRAVLVDQNTNFLLANGDITDINYDPIEDRLVALGIDLWAIDTSSGDISTLAPSIEGYAFKLSPDGVNVYIGAVSGRFYQLDLSGNIETTISDSNTSVLGLTLADDDATAFLLDSLDDGVFSVDLMSGNQFEVSGKNSGQGVPINHLRDIVFDSASLKLIASDVNERHIITIDTVTGERSMLTSESVGNGAQINSIAPAGLEYDPSKNVLYIVDGVTGAIVMVDRLSGDKVTISR
ncbi:hypothetical protein R50072_01960 [Simiduia litorea]